jgi:chromate transporter
MALYWDLFIAFFKCGIFGFGGGQATVPLIENEVVNTFGWLTIGEFSDAYALVNTLPGPITTKMAALVGYKMGGLLGMIVSIVGIVLPSVVAVIILFSLYNTYKEAKWLKGMMKGVRPVVVILIIQVFYRVAKIAYGLETADQFSLIAAGISVVAGVSLFYFKVHPIILIIISLIFGGLFLG